MIFRISVNFIFLDCNYSTSINYWRVIIIIVVVGVALVKLT